MLAFNYKLWELIALVGPQKIKDTIRTEIPRLPRLLANPPTLTHNYPLSKYYTIIQLSFQLIHILPTPQISSLTGNTDIKTISSWLVWPLRPSWSKTKNNNPKIKLVGVFVLASIEKFMKD